MDDHRAAHPREAESVHAPEAPRRLPDAVTADKAYHSHDHVIDVSLRGVVYRTPKAGVADANASGEKLGRVCWVVARTIACLHQFRSHRVRHERCANIHQAFLTLACILICSCTLAQGL